MLDIIKFVADMFSSIYEALDIQVFPDINLSLIEILIGIVLFGVLIKFIFTLGGTSNFSIGGTVRGMINDSRNRRHYFENRDAYKARNSKK